MLVSTLQSEGRYTGLVGKIVALSIPLKLASSTMGTMGVGLGIVMPCFFFFSYMYIREL